RNLLIYPNFVVNDIMSATLRTFYPVRADFMEVNAWAVGPVEETGARLKTRLHNFLEFLGPGGFATPDDVEALESCQIGFDAGGAAAERIAFELDGAGSARAYGGDLSAFAAARALIGEAVDAFGRLDLLVNNAGGGVIRAFMDHDDTSIEETIARNLLTTIH